MTVGEVADLFHVSTKTVVRWTASGLLPCMTTLGGHRRFDRAEVLEAAAAHGFVVAAPVSAAPVADTPKRRVRK